MAERRTFRAYRALDAREGFRASGPMHDADVVILLALVAPAFLAVVVWAFMSGQSVGAGPTVCGAFVVLAISSAVSALRGRRRHRLQ
jgi:hypothetical protein